MAGDKSWSVAALPQNVVFALGAAAGVWYVALPLSATIYYSRISGMKVRVGRVCVSRFRPCLRQVKVKSPEDDTELVTMEHVVTGGSGGVDATATNAHFNVVFGTRDLKATSWDVVQAALWAPRIAFAGDVAVTLRLLGEREPFVRSVKFDAQRVEALRGGAVGSVVFVRALTRDALRADYTRLPKEIRSAARRLIRERIAQDAEKVRKSTVAIIGDLREATREVDAALDGLPDLQHYREYARQTDSFLGKVSSWLGGNIDTSESSNRSTELRERAAQRMPVNGYRLLDEGPAF